MITFFKYYLSNERSFLEKSGGAHSREALIKHFTSKEGALFQGGALSNISALSSKYGMCLWSHVNGLSSRLLKFRVLDVGLSTNKHSQDIF